ncbi:DUF563 domain-containing protein [Oscillatoriales cyanobacterium LEGE 11467]|uniref:DUF563 domain-containing protein n=2 Tax=Zarconia TaxID=2992130 RepID=A0A928Z7G6_9CYAN|nr:DUF563 domain-containing protein [Zarconia navalis LEGE 11467]
MELRQLQAQAYRYFVEEQYDRAIGLYQRCIDAEPSTLRHYWYLGLVFLLQGEDERCQEVWLSAIFSSSPDGVESDFQELLEILNFQGDRYFKLHRFEVAAQIYLAILEIDAECPYAYYSLGRTLSQQGRFDEAIEYWQIATQLDANLIEAYRSQGIVFQKLEQFDEAISCYRSFLEGKADSQVCYDLGLCLLKNQQVEDAIACFEKAIELKANFADAYGDLGYAWLKKGDRTKAISYFKQAVLLKSEFIRAWLDQKKTNTNRYQFLASLIKNSNFDEVNSYLINLVLSFSQSKKSLTEFKKNKAWIPFNFYNLTLEWSNSIDVENTYIPILPEISIDLKIPKINQDSIHFSFRFEKQLKLPGSFVAIVPEGRYWINDDRTQSATITAENRFIADLSPDFPILSPNHPDKHPSNHSILSQEALEPVREIDGTVAILSGLLNNVYFHWMFDVLPRIELLHRSQLDLEEVDFYLTSIQHPFQKETLKILNIANDKILQVESFSHIRAKKLVVPSFPGSISWMPPWTCNFLKHHFSENDFIEKSNFPKRIYISRNNSKIRRVINEREVMKVLGEYGFICVTLETMSVREQAVMFSRADAIVAPHGSGLTNLAFCRSNTKVIEIFSPSYVYHCYWYISNLVNLEYYYLLGETLPGFYLNKLIYPAEQAEDIWIDPKKLRETIAFARINRSNEFSHF